MDKLKYNIFENSMKKLSYVKYYSIFRFSCAAPVEIHLQPLVGTTEGLPPCPVNSREVSQPVSR
jgi:hypothetical protein